MKICIFNGFPFHYEMFGYIIDYCKERKITLDIYTESESGLGWLDFYRANFENDFTIYPISKYSPINDYDKIILTTDDDKYFLDEWINSKTICIDHVNINRRLQISKHIGIRNFTCRPELDWILPVYRMIDVETKKNIAKNQIVFLGDSNCPKNIQIFMKRFPDLNQCKLIFINRLIHNKDFYADFPNTEIYENLDTSIMIDMLKTSKYVFLLDEYAKGIATCIRGVLPIAFNCLCQIIMPKKMNDFYKFNSVFTYRNSIKPKEPNYERINNELITLIQRKFTIFDKYIC